MFRRSRSRTKETLWCPLPSHLELTIGIKSVDISLKDQLVKVDATSASYQDVENAIKKTGKVIKSGKVVDLPNGVEKAPAVVA